MSVKMIAEILIQYLQMVVKDKKGYVFLMTNGNKFISEPKISKFVHILFESRIKDAGFDVDISPETNAGNGPVDFKISRGDDKILIENKISSNTKLLECIDEIAILCNNCKKVYGFSDVKYKHNCPKEL